METADYSVRSVGLTPLATWVLDNTCGKPVRPALVHPRYGRRTFTQPTETCMRSRDHGGECSPKLTRGDASNVRTAG